MANHIQQLLNTWHPQKDTLAWILATIIETEGSSYRKPGAMMMINSLGQYYGLLSGGCLESDIMRQSRQCWETGNNRIIQYDMREEEDIAWQLGIGCGGLVRILLQAVDEHNNYLELEHLRALINQNHACKYVQNLQETKPENHVFSLNYINNESSEKQHAKRNKETATLTDLDTNIHKQNHNKLALAFEHIIQPARKLAIFGAGIDAIPVVKIANDLGWHVTLADSRSGYARKTQFTGAKQIVKATFNDIQEHHYLHSVDAIVIMTHNVELDALALKLAQKSQAKYVGMLGPIHRTDRVLAQAKLVRTKHSAISEENVEQNEVLTKPLANPIGLRLGGELPESIALSIIAEIHAFIEGADAKSISALLP